jgi:hypothetical protein
MTYNTLSYMCVISVTSDDHCWHIGAVEFMMNKFVCILNPWDFPLLLFEVFKFVVRMEN